MSNGTTPAPMTALQGFRLLAEDIIPKLIKRIAALEQGGAAQPDTEQIELHIVTRAMQEVKKQIEASIGEAREHLLAQFDDQAKRLDELEQFIESIKDERASKAKRLTNRRKKKEEAPAPEAMPEPIAEPVAEPVATVTEEQPPVVLLDENQDQLAEAMAFAEQMEQPQPAPSPEPVQEEQSQATYEAAVQQIKAFVNVGLPIEDIASRFGLTVEQVQSIVND